VKEVETLKQEIVTVTAKVTVSHLMRTKLTSEDIAIRTKRTLAGEIAKQLIEHLDELPIVYIVSEIVQPYRDRYNPDEEEHTMRLNIIGDAELKRLREYEHICKEYNFRRMDADPVFNINPYD
jgi:hypothetical protein